MDAILSSIRNRQEDIVKLDEQEVLLSKNFRYLETIIQRDGEFVEDIIYKVKSRRLK